MDMQPKLIFLGTGGDSIVVGKQIRSAGGIILQVEGNQFHIDPGPGSVTRAKDYGINLRNNVAVLITHNHLNHACGINAVINSMTLGGLDKKGVLVANRTAIEGCEENEPYLNKHHKEMIERNIIIEPGKRVGINEVEIWATRAHHSDPHAVGFKFMTPKFVLGYTGDTGYSNSLLEDFKSSDILILNCVNPSDKKDTNHLDINDVLKLLPEIKPKLAIITHFGVKMEELDVLHQARDIQRETKVQTIAAKDGMVINPVSYSVSLRQKTLKLF